MADGYQVPAIDLLGLERVLLGVKATSEDTADGVVTCPQGVTVSITRQGAGSPSSRAASHRGH